MRGTAAPAFFSLGLPSALLKQTRSSGVNASSRHSQRARRKRGGTHISRTEWGGVGVASRKPESAPLATLPLISVSSPGGAAKHWDWTRPCRYPHSVSRLRLVGTVRTYLGAAESLVSCASSSVVAFLLTEHMVPEDHSILDVPAGIKEQLRMSDPSSVWSVGNWLSAGARTINLIFFCRRSLQCAGAIWSMDREVQIGLSMISVTIITDFSANLWSDMGVTCVWLFVDCCRLD